LTRKKPGAVSMNGVQKLMIARSRRIVSRRQTSDVPPASFNPEKDPDDWVTKDEPMTGPQRSYLQTFCREAGEQLNGNWTKAEASKKIDELQQKTGRGKSGTARS
jgi:hypothetical protein